MAKYDSLGSLWYADPDSKEPIWLAGTTGQILYYDGTQGKWVLLDPVDGGTLVINASTHMPEWVSVPPSALELTDGTHDLTNVAKVTVSGATVGGTSLAATLTITGLPSGTLGDVLYYDGANWVVLHKTDGGMLVINPATHKPTWIAGSAGSLPYIGADGSWTLLPPPS